MPAGTWHVRNYRIEKTHEGVEWFLSGSASPGPAIEIKEGEESKLEIDETVRLKVRTQRHQGKVMIQFGIAGNDGVGLSVVRDNARPVPKWRVTSGETELASGDCSYG